MGNGNGPDHDSRGRSMGGRPNQPGGESSRHARIPASVIPRLAGLSKRAVVVYLAVAAHADKDGVCWPTRESVADLTGLSEQSVKKGGSELVQEGLLTHERVGSRRWLYRLSGGYETQAGGYESYPPGGYVSYPPKEQPTRTESLPADAGNRTRPDGHASGVSLSPMRPLPQTVGQITLSGEVEQPQPDWPNEVRRAYFAAWKHRYGNTPPAAYAERMMGKVREVERSIRRHGCDDEWPLWVEAARRAAAKGQWDIVGCFPTPSQAGKTSRALALARRLDEMGA